MEFENGDIVAIAYTNSLDYGIVHKQTPVSLQFYPLYSYLRSDGAANLPNGEYSWLIDSLQNNKPFKKSFTNTPNACNGDRILKITKELLPVDKRVVYDELIKLL